MATLHEFPGCIGQGQTSAEALRSLEESAKSWIAAITAAGKEVPPPATYDDCSGKIALRISKRLHTQAAERADIEGVSLNQLISTAIAKYLATEDAKQEVRDLLVRLENRETEPALTMAYVYLHRAGSDTAITSFSSLTARDRGEPSLLTRGGAPNATVPEILRLGSDWYANGN